MELIHRIILRLNKKDNEKLREVAHSKGVTVSKYVRQIIRDNIWGKK